MDRPRVGIVGGSGYGGGELLRILLGHPGVDVTAVTSRRNAGRPVSDVHQNLLGITDLVFSDVEPAGETDVLFFALPHGKAAERMPALLDAVPDTRIIDLSGDFRLDSAEEWTAAYGRQHPAPDLVESFVYGLTEINREDIAAARRIANPGCFATGAILALLPLADAGLLEGDVALTGITGSSGSGAEAKATTHHPERSGDFRSYRALSHQHQPEIRMALETAGARSFRPAMVPHSAPLVRGIFTSATFFPKEPIAPDRVRRIYAERCDPEPFLRLRDVTPRLAIVRGTNFCDLAVSAREDGSAVVTMSAIDNLVKGMAGQAVQNMNLLFGLAESEGLRFTGSRP